MIQPAKITLDEWDARYLELKNSGLVEPEYGGRLRRHAEGGDRRLYNLRFDNSPAALRLWNFLLTEEERLHKARKMGWKIVGAMKDLGTVPVIAFSLPNVAAFYPDGAWWLPCLKEMNSGVLQIASSLGLGESFCPVRAMVGAFINQKHFPIPDLLTCSVGATCDDFCAIAQRLESLGHPILWWETPHRRSNGEAQLPGGFSAAKSQVEFVKSELERICRAIEDLSGNELGDVLLHEGIVRANRIRAALQRLRCLVYTADICPMPALEMLIAEMLAIHFCSDQKECGIVLDNLLSEVESRVAAGLGHQSRDAVRVFWVNPVADIRVMNLLEDCGGRICGTDYLFSHALDSIPEDMPPLEALARMVLADPMVGSSRERAERICRDIKLFGAEALVVSRIPGASHCAIEGSIIRRIVHETLKIPTAEIEVSSVSDSFMPSLRTKLEALIESVMSMRKK